MNQDPRLTAFGNQLIQTHLWLREELASLRAAVEDHLTGTPLPDRSRPLGAHCLAFCTALTTHHTDEDASTFPAVAAAHPELAPVLATLSRDHHEVAGLLRRMEAVVAGLSPAPDAAEARQARSELDSLAALLESHFVYEENQLVSVLNGLTDPGTAARSAG
ncbi:hemerythrin domain-containing protein [Nonomuraea sp. NBC_01738]|uniref:hemerythrin domain-containing protein n=1 Tax=Nonomuraea sp. NBC_01738 TaxID=2976003 RepID=UPI002E111937|nr:hemerythrin domain-containing protein [Nonomuraea sp. NBC_01738]